MVEDKIYEMIREEFGVEEVNRDMNLQEDFNVDSISALEFIMDIEEEFNIEIEDEKIMNLQTIGDVIDYIEENK